MLATQQLIFSIQSPLKTRQLLTEEIGRRTSEVTEDQKETSYLYQRLSATIQRGNAVSFPSTFATEQAIAIMQ